MDNKLFEELLKKLDKMNQSLESISSSVEKPKVSRFVRIMEFIVLFGGITIFITAADIIRNWIIGG